MTYQNKKLTINKIFNGPAVSAKDNIPFSFLDEHVTRQTKDQSNCEKFWEYKRDSNWNVQDSSYQWYTKGKYGSHNGCGGDGSPSCTTAFTNGIQGGGKWLALVYDSPYQLCTGWCGGVSPLCTMALANCIWREGGCFNLVRDKGRRMVHPCIYGVTGLSWKCLNWWN